MLRTDELHSGSIKGRCPTGRLRFQERKTKQNKSVSILQSSFEDQVPKEVFTAHSPRAYLEIAIL